MVGPQSYFSSNRASMDGTGDEKTWMVPAMRKKRKRRWYRQRERRGSVDGTGEKKEEEEVGTLDGPLSF